MGETQYCRHEYAWIDEVVAKKREANSHKAKGHRVCCATASILQHATTTVCTAHPFFNQSLSTTFCLRCWIHLLVAKRLIEVLPPAAPVPSAPTPTPIPSIAINLLSSSSPLYFWYSRKLPMTWPVQRVSWFQSHWWLIKCADNVTENKFIRAGDLSAQHSKADHDPSQCWPC